MPLPPFPVLPSPRTWAAGDQAWTQRLNTDLYNAALLLQNRPLFVAQQATTGQSIPTTATTAVQLDTDLLDSWQVHQIPNATYPAPLAGWYLAEGTAILASASGTALFSAGIQIFQNAVGSTLFGNWLCGNGVNNNGPSCADLVQLNPATSDTVALVADQTTGAAVNLATPGAYFKAEWAGMPSSISGYTGPVGTVVTSPQPAALWPRGSGTTITNVGGIPAGATSMTVASNTGMVIGAVLGLDYLSNAPFAPVAETVTITSISGTTIGISATAYPHLQNAPVAVPVSAPWMNQQARDLINFLAYPPMARIIQTVSQSIPNTAFPAGTAVTFGSATLDNFTGWSAGTPGQYTFQQPGVYYVYGQVPFQAATGNVSAGISIAGGTILWGDSVRNQTSQIAAATVRKHVRVTAGQTLQLMASQLNGATLGTQVDANKYATLLVVWRGF